MIRTAGCSLNCLHPPGPPAVQECDHHLPPPHGPPCSPWSMVCSFETFPLASCGIPFRDKSSAKARLEHARGKNSASPFAENYATGGQGGERRLQRLITTGSLLMWIASTHRLLTPASRGATLPWCQPADPGTWYQEKGNSIPMCALSPSDCLSRITAPMPANQQKINWAWDGFVPSALDSCSAGPVGIGSAIPLRRSFPAAANSVPHCRSGPGPLAFRPAGIL